MRKQIFRFNIIIRTLYKQITKIKNISFFKCLELMMAVSLV